jgi:ribosomal protein S18 acetylase RimI-like enzyme
MSASHPSIRIETVERPDRELVRQVNDGLTQFNRQHILHDNYLPISVFARNSDGKIVGGAVCAVYWNAFTVEMLWLEESLRGHGIGTLLMLDAEAAARQHRCDFMHVDTMSFQARSFYEKLGFVLFGTLPGYPNGVERYYMHKPLV